MTKRGYQILAKVTQFGYNELGLGNFYDEQEKAACTK